MKSRLNVDGKTFTVLPQPDGYTPLSKAFVNQYNAACRIVGDLIPQFNKDNDNKELGQEEYERRYYELFLKCINEVPLDVKTYKFMYYDGDDYEYELIT